MASLFYLLLFVTIYKCFFSFRHLHTAAARWRESDAFARTVSSQTSASTVWPASKKMLPFWHSATAPLSRSSLYDSSTPLADESLNSGIAKRARSSGRRVWYITMQLFHTTAQRRFHFFSRCSPRVLNHPLYPALPSLHLLHTRLQQLLPRLLLSPPLETSGSPLGSSFVLLMLMME